MTVVAFTQSAIAAWLFVFARVAGWAVFDPVLGRLPLFIRLMLAAVLAMALLPTVGVPRVEPFGLAGGVALALECLLGALLALMIRMLFAATAAILVWAGQTATGGLLALTTEQAEPADRSLRQLAWWLATLAFLAANGHLLAIHAIQQSLIHAPVATLPSADSARQIIEGAGWIFAAGVQLALPLLVFALLLHLALGMLARSQPGVDFFSMGLTLGALGLLAALLWAVPLIALGIEQGLARVQPWLAWWMH
jgi:flagellar biosynthetic protein FliR